MNKIAMFKGICLAGTAACAGIAAPAWSQNAGAGPTAAVETDTSEIVVTAQRRTERLENVPMAISALSEDAIKNSGIVSVRDLGQITAGLKFDFSGAFTQPTIRGISSLTTGVGFENNVAIYIDGFYAPDSVTINTDLPNIAGVEVLKGPQGTLWGRNATGGAILINTKAPSKDLQGSIEAAYSRFNDRSIKGYISGPISEKIRASLAGNFRKSDGYIKHLDAAGRKDGDAAPIKQASARLKVEADLSEALTATLGVNYGYSSDPRGLLFVYYRNTSSILPPSPPRASERNTASNNYPTRNIGKTYEQTLKFAWDTGIGKVTAYGGYSHRVLDYAFDFDGSHINNLANDRVWRENTFQGGIDYNIDAITGVDLVIGGTFYRDTLKQRDGRTINGGVIVDLTDTTLRGTAFAGYVDATFEVTDALSIGIGGRYTWEKKEIAYSRVRPNGTDVVVPANKQKSFSDFTPRASLRYEIAPRTNIYAAFSQGFRSGGFNPTTVATPALLIPFKPEQIKAYEIGFKTARSWIRFDVAAFYYDYKDLQVGVTVPNPVGGGIVNLVSNADKARVYGLDSQVELFPAEHLTIRSGLSVLHARYRDFPNATGNGLNIATSLNATGQIQDWSGKQMARAPRLSGNLGAEYEFQNVAGGKLRVAGNIFRTASFVLNNPSLYGPLAGAALAGKQRFRQGAYSVVNAQISWVDASEHFRVTLFSDNLTNEKYLIAKDGGAFGEYRLFAPPISYGVRVGYYF